MAETFLSYAREDRAFAELLAQLLEGAGHSLWWDRRIDGGDEFSTEIEAELDRSEVVLVAWSKDSIKSRWVRVRPPEHRKV
jgi:adenylate cyclase